MKRRLLSLTKKFIYSLILAFILHVNGSTQAPSPAEAQTPTPFLVTPYYGTETVSQDYHSGHKAHDYAMGYEKVLAAADGTVSKVDWFNDQCHRSSTDQSCGYGLYVRIDHANGYQTWYAHLSAATFPFIDSNGPQVTRGQIIGTSGNTGWSTGPHLHFELRQNNVNVDPDNPSLWLDGQWANPSRPIPAPPQGQTIIIDDNTTNSGGFKKGRLGGIECPPSSCPYWYRVTSGGYSSDYYWTNASLYDDYWARWSPAITAQNQGWYEVQVYIPATTNATTWQAPYSIQHADGAATATVDQYDAQNAPGHWVSLGPYRLTPGNASVRVNDGTLEGYQVHCSSTTGGPSGQNYCRVAADAVRFIKIGPTYLPEVRSEYDGWDSAIQVRNDGAGPTPVSFTLLNENGTVKATFTSNSVPAHGRLYYNYDLPGLTDNWQGSVMVDAAQAVSVVVVHQNLSPYAVAAYTGVGQPASAVHVPLLHKNNNGWYSQLFIQNTGPSATNLTVDFKAFAGSSCTQTYSLPGRGLKIVSLSSVSCLGAAFAGAAYITNSANQPLAVAATQYPGDNTSLMESSLASGAASAVYGPLLHNNNNGWTSGLSLQNASGGSNTLTATFYRDTGQPSCSSSSYNLAARYPYILAPAPPAGSGCPPEVSLRLSGSGGPAAAIVNQRQPGDARAASYEAVATPGQAVSVPYRLQNVSGWSGRIVVQNVNNQATTVTIRYYNSNGALVSSDGQTLAAYARGSFGAIPNLSSFDGSAVVTADRPVAVIVNHILGGATSDAFMSYSAVHR